MGIQVREFLQEARSTLLTALLEAILAVQAVWPLTVTLRWVHIAEVQALHQAVAAEITAAAAAADQPAAAVTAETAQRSQRELPVLQVLLQQELPEEQAEQMVPLEIRESFPEAAAAVKDSVADSS